MHVEDLFDAANQYRTRHNRLCYCKSNEQANVDVSLEMDDSSADDRQLRKTRNAASLVHNRLSNEHKFSINTYTMMAIAYIWSPTAVVIIC